MGGRCDAGEGWAALGRLSGPAKACQGQQAACRIESSGASPVRAAHQTRRPRPRWRQQRSPNRCQLCRLRWRQSRSHRGRHRRRRCPTRHWRRRQRWRRRLRRWGWASPRARSCGPGAWQRTCAACCAMGGGAQRGAAAVLASRMQASRQRTAQPVAAAARPLLEHTCRRSSCRSQSPTGGRRSRTRASPWCSRQSRRARCPSRRSQRRRRLRMRRPAQKHPSRPSRRSRSPSRTMRRRRRLRSRPTARRSGRSPLGGGRGRGRVAGGGGWVGAVSAGEGAGARQPAGVGQAGVPRRSQGVCMRGEAHVAARRQVRRPPTVLAQSLAIRSSLAAREQSTLAVWPAPATPTAVVSATVGWPACASAGMGVGRGTSSVWARMRMGAQGAAQLRAHAGSAMQLPPHAGRHAGARMHAHAAAAQRDTRGAGNAACGLARRGAHRASAWRPCMACAPHPWTWPATMTSHRPSHRRSPARSTGRARPPGACAARSRLGSAHARGAPRARQLTGGHSAPPSRLCPVATALQGPVGGGCGPARLHPNARPACCGCPHGHAPGERARRRMRRAVPKAAGAAPQDAATGGSRAPTSRLDHAASWQRPAPRRTSGAAGQ